MIDIKIIETATDFCIRPLCLYYS